MSTDEFELFGYYALFFDDLLMEERFLERTGEGGIYPSETICRRGILFESILGLLTKQTNSRGW